MEELAKSIRVGTVNFFGVVVPGLLLLFVMYIGFVMPVISTLALITCDDPNIREQTITTVKELDATSAVTKTVETTTIQQTLSDVVNIAANQFGPEKWATDYQILNVLILLVLSYVFGYILRLSSPDELDRISAIHVLKEEQKYHEWKTISEFRKEALSSCKSKAEEERIPNEQKLHKKLTGSFWYIFPKHRLEPFQNKKKVFFDNPGLTEAKFEEEVKKCKDDDKWPFDPYDYCDKYPYLKFKEYLIGRGHEQSLAKLVVWGPLKGKASDPKRRSKTHVNQMKMDIREHCPELMGPLESKEAHIRLMAGTWAAFRFSLPFVAITAVAMLVVSLLAKSLNIQNNVGSVWLFFFICSLCAIGMWISIWRIKKLFHYRRVNELFHIVEAADLARQKKECGNSEKPSEEQTINVVLGRHSK